MEKGKKNRDRITGIVLLIMSFVFLMGTIIYKDMEENERDEVEKRKISDVEEEMRKLEEETLSDKEIDIILTEGKEKLEKFPEESEKLFKRIENYRGEAAYYLGLKEYKKGNYGQATEYAEKAAKLGNCEAMYLLGEIYFREKKYEEAEKWFLKAENQGIFQSTEKLEKIYREKGEVEKREKILFRLSERKSRPHMYELGKIYIRKGKYEEAAELFNFLMQEGNLKAKNRLEDIEEILKGGKTEKNSVEKIDVSEKKISKSEVEAIFREARKLFFTDAEKAKIYFEKIEKYKPRATFYLAEYYMERLELAEAEKWLLNGAERGEALSMQELGDIYLEKEDYKEAEKWYTELLAGKYMAALVGLGKVYERQGNYVEAEKLYERALRNNKGEAENSLAIIYMKEGKSEKSEELLKSSMGKGDFYGMSNLFEKYYKEGRYREAEDIYVKLSDEETLFLNVKMGEMKELQEEYEEAEKYYTTAAEKGNVKAMLRLALLLDRKKGGKDKEKSVVWYEKAANEGEGEAMYYLAEMYRKDFNDIGLAQKWYMKALRNGRMDAKIRLREIKDRG